MYCWEGRCNEGAYIVTRTVGNTVFLQIAGKRNLHLVIYLKAGSSIGVAEEDGPAFQFSKSANLSPRR